MGIVPVKGRQGLPIPMTLFWLCMPVDAQKIIKFSPMGMGVPHLDKFPVFFKMASLLAFGKCWEICDHWCKGCNCDVKWDVWGNAGQSKVQLSPQIQGTLVDWGGALFPIHIFLWHGYMDEDAYLVEAIYLFCIKSWAQMSQNGLSTSYLYWGHGGGIFTEENRTWCLVSS